MWNPKYSLSLLICVILITIKGYADSSACVKTEKRLAVLDMAKESISKAKNLHLASVNDDIGISVHVVECGSKEKVSAYLDIAMNLIEEAKICKCDENRNLTEVILRYKKSIDCSEVFENGHRKSGIYTIYPRLRSGPLKVYCDMDTDGGGWTMIQRRGPFSKKVNFYRDWKDYKFGFGNISEEFWIGNENIFALTKQGNYSARFDMQGADKSHRFATYSPFRIEDENAGYQLYFKKYSGTAGDGLKTENNTKFSTLDNDEHDDYIGHCPSLRQSGWWWSGCGFSNPNGRNFQNGKEEVECTTQECMSWEPLEPLGSLLAIEIKIRPEDRARKYSQND